MADFLIRDIDPKLKRRLRPVSLSLFQGHTPAIEEVKRFHDHLFSKEGRFIPRFAGWSLTDPQQPQTPTG